MTMSCARALTVAVEPVCGVGRLRLAYGARCNQRHRPRAVDGRAAPRLRGHTARRPSRRGPAITTTPRSGRPTSTRSTRTGRSSGPASGGGCLPAIPGARRPRIRRRRRHFPIGRRECAPGRRVRGRSLKGVTAMPHPSSGSPSSASRTPRFERPVWDAALRPAQRRAGLGRARLEQRRLADARRQRLITVWLRELANH
jgi:hypothetical protein